MKSPISSDPCIDRRRPLRASASGPVFTRRSPGRSKASLGTCCIHRVLCDHHPPQAAILSIGSIRNVPVVNDKGAIVAGQRMWVGLSGDHRVVDGAVAATYLTELRKLLEIPALMLV